MALHAMKHVVLSSALIACFAQGCGGASDVASDAAGRDGSTDEHVLTCSPGLVFGTGHAMTDIEESVIAARPGDVICLMRDAVFEAVDGLAIDGVVGTEAQPITLCSSDGVSCTATGGANARLQVSGNFGLHFGTGTEWIAVRDIDLWGDDTGNAVDFGYGQAAAPHHVEILGGLCRDWELCWISDPWSNTSGPPAHISLGSCAHPWTIRHTVGYAGGGYGYFQDSILAMDVADTGNSGVFSHNIYFSTGPYEGEIGGLVVECSRFSDSGRSGETSLGIHLKISGHVSSAIVRNNLFEDDNCDTYTLGVTSSNDDVATEYASLEVYGNVFRTDCAMDIECGACNHSAIYNNVFERLPDRHNNTGYVVHFGDAAQNAARFGSNRVFNNTIVDVHNSGLEGGIVAFDNDQLADNEVYNNLFYSTNAAVNVVGAACERFGGAGGSGLKHNFIYTPNDATPAMPSCAASSGNSTTYDVAPGLAAAADGDYHITSDSRVAGAGSAAGAPANDFDGYPRPSSPSIGAFDVHN